VRRRRARHVDRGAVAVEFALVFPLAALLLAFLIAVGLRVFWSALADNVARAAARYAAVANSQGHYPQGNAPVDTMQSVTAHAATAYQGVLGNPQSVTGSDCTSAGTGNTDENACDGLPLTSAFQCTREGDLIAVRVQYHVPLIGALGLSDFATVTHVARARCE
jgi:Flp pilus assembly protein TadG